MTGIQEVLSNIRNLSEEKDTLIQSLEADNNSLTSQKRQASQVLFEINIIRSHWLACIEVA